MSQIDMKQVISLLEDIAKLLELKGENPFKTRAYTNGARALRSVNSSIQDLIESGELAKMKGFGSALVSKITTYVETGELAYYNELRASFPDGLLDIMELNGVGPKKAKLFYDKLKVSNTEELKKACEDGSIAELAGCGPKTAANILEAIERKQTMAAFFLFPKAWSVAQQVVESLRGVPELQQIEVAGSLRRFKETTKDADIIGAADDPAPVMDAFVKLPDIAKVLAKGETKSSVIFENGVQVDLRLVKPEVFASALHHFTGSKDHNVAMRSRAIRMGMKVSEWGLFKTAGGVEELIPCQSEEELFRHLGLPYIVPDLREGMGEIEAAEKDALPKLVELKDYQGLLHCHTQASDGGNTLDELVEKAQSLGYAYLGITDHSKSSFQANGLSAERLLDQVGAIRRKQQELGDELRLFSGVECDILTDGSLDYEDEVLDQLDFFVISVHNAFTRSKEEQTARMIKAIEHSGSRILAHMTGRLLLKRDAYEIDIPKIIDACIVNKVAIELNCHPMRMDMDWRLWKHAAEKGALCSINCDAHSLRNFD